VSGTRKVKPQVLLLGAVALLNDASSDMVYPLLPLFLTLQAGATPLIVGIIEGLAEATAAILKYTAGTFSDRLPFRKPLVIGGYGLTATSRVIIAAAGAWPIVLAGRLLDRTGKGIRSAPRDAMIADVTPVENRGLAFGTLRARMVPSRGVLDGGRADHRWSDPPFLHSGTKAGTDDLAR